MERENTADLIVIGLGAMGSATVDAAARQGHSVIGIEAFAQGHDRGSSHGPTRMLRRIAEEGSAYIPLILDALPRWRELNDELEQPVFIENGAIRVGPIETPLHRAFDACGAAFDLERETLSASDIVDRFPGFAVPDGYEARFEPEAGILFADRTVRALQDRAERHDARLHFDQRVISWDAVGDGVVVHTEHETYHASRLVITAGAWISRLTAELHLPLHAKRVVNVSFEPFDRGLFTPERLPAFAISNGDDGVYGIPAVDGQGLKVGGSGTPVDPDHVDRAVGADEIAHLRSFVERFLPKAAGPVSSTLTCLYTVAADEHFVIGHHPVHRQVVIASPCSGHGFKYTTAIGPVLAELAFSGSSSIPIDAFAIDRPALAPTQLASTQLTQTGTPS